MLVNPHTAVVYPVPVCFSLTLTCFDPHLAACAFVLEVCTVCLLTSRLHPGMYWPKHGQAFTIPSAFETLFVTRTNLCHLRTHHVQSGILFIRGAWKGLGTRTNLHTCVRVRLGSNGALCAGLLPTSHQFAVSRPPNYALAACCICGLRAGLHHRPHVSSAPVRRVLPVRACQHNACRERQLFQVFCKACGRI